MFTTLKLKGESMSFTKILLSAAFLICFATAGRAQVACTLTVDKAPEIRGIRLGMPMSEIKSFAPDIRINDQRFGESIAELDQLNKRDAVRFEGVSTIFFHFVDERLTGFSVSYDNSVYWDSASQFIAKISEALKLPAAWEGETMNCNGFKITAQPNNISLAETNAENVVRRRALAEAERKRQNFRP
jgi:hypothetical protein